MENQHIYCTNCKHLKSSEDRPYCEYDEKVCVILEIVRTADRHQKDHVTRE